MKKYYFSQAFILFIGIIVAFLSVYDDFMRFYGAEGTFFKIENCLYSHPVLTPCFYGAFAFLGAFIWTLFVVKKEVVARIRQEKYLSWFLTGGVFFAWGNFTKLYLDYVKGSQIGCSGAPMTIPFLTPCFYGSILFLFALALSWITLWKENKKS
ncbi:MAG: hypothetical protein NT098_03505 [Candidatus Parcubacteria bacterium]|nr:hypothetical protein [Candidatus Parcubacteria bacterium]